MHLSKNKRGLSKISNLVINDRTIASKKSIKVLGVTIDSRLNFKEHIKNVCHMNEVCLRLLKTISGKAIGASRTTMINIMNSWLIPKMLYGYGLYSREDQKSLDKLVGKPHLSSGASLHIGSFYNEPNTVDSG